MVEMAKSFREAQEAKRAKQLDYNRRFEAGEELEDNSIIPRMQFVSVRHLGRRKVQIAGFRPG
jgi:hypothetical protein